MNWYWNLAHLLLDNNKAVESSAGLRVELESHIAQLYQKLLLYQIKSICLYHRNQFLVIVRDLLSLEGWAGQLSDIQEAEDAVKRDAEQYNSEQVKEYIRSLATNAVSQEKKLDSIYLAIQDQTQQQEKRYQDDKDKQCLKDLYETNPIKDKERIQDTKGGLLKDSYLWILDNADFRQFCNDPQSQLLWIKGDPGKGKTMLLCGIIDELQKEPNKTLSYFFCQATEAQLSNATSVLRGLMHLLLDKRPSLISHLRAKYDTAGKKLFQGINVWGSLVEILTDMLNDSTLTDAVFVVDALDECTANRSQLLDFIIQSSSSSSSHVKWIISSRNWPEIEEKLDIAKQKVQLQLELNQSSISNAITTYIDHRVDQLARVKKYDEETKSAVQRHLADNADGTFLWVALVCQELIGPSVRKRHTLIKLRSYPPGLNSLYGQMMALVSGSADAAHCKEILAITSIVYRPVGLEELKVLARSLEDFSQDELREIIRSCGSFLTLRDDIVYFVHQSAKDYLLNEASNDILPSGTPDQHHAIFLRSLKALLQTLERDIYGLGAPGLLIDQVSPPDLDPLAMIRYSTTYWVDHLSDSKFTETGRDSDVQDSGVIYDFIQKKYLYWLESLSLLHCLPEGVAAVQKLEDMIRCKNLRQLAELLQDARRFILSYKSVIEIAPLQLYTSALMFSPVSSLVRKFFNTEEPDWVTLKPITRPDWGECLQTLEGHGDAVRSVAFSPDSKLVASASEDQTIRIWRADTGECLQTLEGHGDGVRSVAFSPDSKLVASASKDQTIRIWRADTGECSQTLEGHGNWVRSVAFSPDSKLVASASDDGTIRIWRADTGECLQALEGHGDAVRSVAFSPDSKLVASASHDQTIRIWRADIGECLQTLKGHGDGVRSVAFSPDSKLVASASDDQMIRIWRADTGECMQTLEGHGDGVSSVAFSPDSKLVASASYDQTIRIWRADTGECSQTLEGHGNWVNSVAFSPDSKLVASASDDQTIRIWRADIGECSQTLEGHGNWVRSVAFSPDSKLVASASDDGTIRIWRADTGECSQALEGHGDAVRSVAFSPDSKLVASASYDQTIRIWRADTGECLQTLKGHGDTVRSVAFSPNLKLVASASYDQTIRIWRADTGECLQTLEGHGNWVSSVAFSPDSKLVASASHDQTIRIWRADTGECLQTLEGHGSAVNSVAFSPDSKLVASASYDRIIRIWRADTGECSQMLEIGFTATILSFEPDNAHLLTTNGSFTILDDRPFIYSSADPLLQPPANVIAHHPVYGISQDNRWITSNGENTLWLPVEIRPTCWAVSSSTIVIGCKSGRVIVVGLSCSGNSEVYGN
ncbi:hypothetical protein GGI43DRAFT_265277 [Trichoderma evansii]